MSNINPIKTVRIESALTETGVHLINILPLLEHRRLLAKQHFEYGRDEVFTKQMIYDLNKKISEILGLNDKPISHENI